MTKIVIDGITYVPEDENKKAPELDGMQFCIIRCYNAGNHAGYLKKWDEKNPVVVTLVNSRRLWKWWGHTLSGLAADGSPTPEKCKYSPVVPKIILLDACEIIFCTEIGRKSILEDVGPWVNN